MALNAHTRDGQFLEIIRQELVYLTRDNRLPGFYRKTVKNTLIPELDRIIQKIESMGQGAYDALVVEHLEHGQSLETALTLAGAAYPEEQLLPESDEEWADLAGYYGMLADADFPIREGGALPPETVCDESKGRAQQSYQIRYPGSPEASLVTVGSEILDAGLADLASRLCGAVVVLPAEATHFGDERGTAYAAPCDIQFVEQQEGEKTSRSIQLVLNPQEDTFEEPAFVVRIEGEDLEVLRGLVLDHFVDAEPRRSHWDEVSGHPVEDWRDEVANDDTRLGYLAWVEHRESEGPLCDTCGEPLTSEEAELHTMCWSCYQDRND